MTNYGTIPTASSEGTNESISTATPQVKRGLRNGRPWKEMVRSLNFPSGFRDTSERIKTNLVYFQTNYMIIFMLFIFLSVFFHPFPNTVLLAILIDFIVVLYFSNSKLIIILVIISVTLLLFTEAAWNVILSSLIEVVVVMAHAILRKTDDLSLDEESAPPAAGIPNARPWKEMLRSLNFPSGFRNTIERMKTNINYFEINYVVILMLILCLSFLWHPISLSLYLNLSTDVLLFLYYLHREPSSVLHGSFRQIIIVFILIGVIALSEAAWINIISSLLMEALFVAVHASFRRTDDLFLVLDEEVAHTAATLNVSAS